MTPLSEPRNRMVQVVKSGAFNGVDFIELPSIDSTTLLVHFLNAVTVEPIAGQTIAAKITGGDRIQGIQVKPIVAADWQSDADGRPVLKLTVNEAGDFSNYTLTLTGAQLDPMYTSAVFCFKVLCPSDFDCAPKSACCAAEEPPLPAIDYTAKDFQSFKQALTDFSAQRYPSWQETSEADFGVMFMEALSAVADELSYLQDRIATESSLLLATQRRSLVSMARLVDYEPSPAISSSTMVQCNVVGATVPAGSLIGAVSPGGVAVPFEIGTGLLDTTQYATSPKWNGPIQPYWFDDSQQCLACGSTSMAIVGHGFGFDAQIANGAMLLLIQTDLPGESLREIVTLTSATEVEDDVFPEGGPPSKVTVIAWATGLAGDHDLTNTHLAGNLLPATQGQRFSESFAVGTVPPGPTWMQTAITRYGPNGTDAEPNWIVRYPLSHSNAAPGQLTWLLPVAATGTGSDPDTGLPQPELIVTRRLPEPLSFSFASSLLAVNATASSFTVDPGAWRVVAADALGNTTQWEYDGGQGDTLRFGDGTFGIAPNEGEVFDLVYRIGLGAAGNVAASAISTIDSGSSAYLTSVGNPFSVTNGADPETAQHIQRMAPQAFRAIQYRAVQPRDYEATAETLPWVLKAGTAFRWTGSWLSVFTSADARAGAAATESNQTDLIDLLNRSRLAGYEAFAPPPVIVSIDLDITVCIQYGWLGSDVEAAVQARLADAIQPSGEPGFFYADSFTFGTPLYRSALLAAIQSVAGVSGVVDIEYRTRGSSNIFQPLPDILPFGSGELLRVQNDPSFPERGTIRVIPEGGR